MSTEQSKHKIFSQGTTWLRADFHLHTKSDKEFVYDGEENGFVTEYITALKIQDIRVGVVTNHNKFNISEFKALRKNARKEEIFLLPGVELSVNDGANGIHTLIVFSDDWLAEGQDYINQFLNVAFVGKTPSQYEQENGRSSLDLLTTLKKLEGYHRDFFVVFAHVEQNSGLWNELDGGRLEEIGNDKMFKRRSLGFQKVRTRDLRGKVQKWFKDWYPAEVEGSDCKSIASIGAGEKCYLKLGSFTFDAVKFSLTDKLSRVSPLPIEHKHSFIRSIRFNGGTLSGKELHLSPELNTMIGIRGSGKSSIIEVLRYVLEIPFEDKAGDIKYKQDLVNYTMGSGGKVEIDIVDCHGQIYTISRVLNEHSSDVIYNGEHVQGLSIRESLLRKPIYFGQKDLSNTGEGFEKDLVNKLLGTKLDVVRENIKNQSVKVIDAVRSLTGGFGIDEQILEQKKVIADAEHQLKFYAEHKVEEKLQKRLDFDADVKQMDENLQAIKAFSDAVKSLVNNHDNTLSSLKDYVSKHNADLFTRFNTLLTSKYFTLISDLKEWDTENTATLEQLSELQSEMQTIRKGMVEEFAGIERALGEELKGADKTNISSKEFLNIKSKLSKATTQIESLQRQKEEQSGNQGKLINAVKSLNDLWHDEFLLINAELRKIEKESSSITIVSEYKGDKHDFVATMKEYCKGSGIREATLQGIAEHYSDFVAVYRDLQNSRQYFGSNPQVFQDKLFENLKSALTYQTPNRFVIKYRGKELQHHSLGQRASALILFVLSLRENDVIIIDQPEDDLDNQTIYEDVIMLIREMKPEVQFIFATHNPNIPVLGDAEQVHACSLVDEDISVFSGSVDDQVTQKNIVDIMEGGKEAFTRRKEIYEIWKP